MIGTRHGEKRYESLLSREDMAAAEDCGGYFRVPLDGRSLNYGLYIDQGTEGIDEVVDYTSHNTTRLSVEQVAEMLWSPARDAQAPWRSPSVRRRDRAIAGHRTGDGFIAWHIRAAARARWGGDVIGLGRAEFETRPAGRGDR